MKKHSTKKNICSPKVNRFCAKEWKKHWFVRLEFDWSKYFFRLSVKKKRGDCGSCERTERVEWIRVCHCFGFVASSKQGR